MAMVLSQKTKMVFGGLLTFMLLGCMLVTGSALGWFSPGGSSELSGELAAKLSQRKHYGLQVFIRFYIIRVLFCWLVAGTFQVRRRINFDGCIRCFYGRLSTLRRRYILNFYARE